MKIRVYISADPRTSHLFTNIDKVKDGTNSAVVEGHCKLVLLRKTGRKEDLMNGFDKKVGDQDELETIAVFNVWTFWRMLPEDTKKCEECGCSVIGDHKNSEGQILCTTCENAIKEGMKYIK